MASSPKEAQEFVRMLVRAFYPDLFAPIVDGILTHSNYVSHHNLSQALHQNPRELRKKMHRLTMTKLVKSEKRQQKKINYADERQPMRTVHTEFWFVPLVEVLDAFQYRVEIIKRELEEETKLEEAQNEYVCLRCNTTYKLLDILNNMAEDGSFICDRVDVQMECGGRIVEQENAGKEQESASLKNMFYDQIQPLIVLANSCSKLDIPAHPLNGVDEKTWGDLVPETIGRDGMPTTEGGGENEAAGKKKDVQYQIDLGIDEQDKAAGEESGKSKDESAVPDKPDWFKETGKEEDDDWDAGANVQIPDETQNEKVKEELERDAYYQKFVEKNMATAGQETDQQALEKERSEEKPGDITKDVKVTIGGVVYNQDDITEELIAKMTPEEYQEFYNQMRSNDDDSDADMF
eukprot:Plantae.Rhodophyta-Hildenbrandia_rubra.ctg7687.p3 GENE.Plantae.Rhodophyta-Hildenbrandia_rubra.ctg7687~~Plantae.Rhodophyta-Hildenbrandia_rubra.ctg7687.p3  ORF type:complete len:406 (-),score=106.32 Plantae.Rhodophyta-Hildenbrandia_rubra.ctg7687:5611-6828(-)